MIIGFEQITQNLPPTLIKVYAELLSVEIRTYHVGVDKKVSNRTLVKYLFQHGHSVREPQIREVIHYLRRHYKFVDDNLNIGIICANSKGYYLSFDKTDIWNYKESLRQRWQSIKEVYDSIN